MFEYYQVNAAELERYCQMLLITNGVPENDAAIIADSLVEANLRGIDSHGVARLPAYIARFRAIPWRPLQVTKDERALGIIDAGDGPGQPASVKGMKLAIEKAEKYGVGTVGVRASNHFGAAGYYAAIAAEKDMIGLVFSNAPARLAPWGGTSPLLGNNPWAIAFPTNRGYPALLDISNSVVAAGKIRLARERGEKIPADWAMDARGRPTMDPQEALDGLLMPIAGHKGYGITFMMEVLTGVLMDTGFSTGVKGIDDSDEPQNMAHLFIALNIDNFIPLERFKENVDNLIARLKSSSLAERVEEIFIPGERSHALMQEKRREGIILPRSLIEKLEMIAEGKKLEKQPWFPRHDL